MASNAAKGGLSGAASGAAAGAALGPWGAAVGGVIGGVSGLLSGGAADEAEEFAETQAYMKEIETRENVRRMRMAAEEEVGLARATVSASGLQQSGSPLNYVNKMRQEWQNNISFTQWTGKKSAESLREAGADAAAGIMGNLYNQQAGQVLMAGASYAAAGGFSQGVNPGANASVNMTSPGPSSTPTMTGTFGSANSRAISPLG